MSRLVTIPVSHFCEKARWALDLAGEPYDEQGWPPALHRFALARWTATTAPVFVRDDGVVLRGSAAIVRHADAVGSLGLFRSTPEEHEEIEALVAEFDARLGPAVRLLVYAALLDEPDAFVAVLGYGLAGRRAASLRIARPVITTTIRRYFRVSERTVAEARDTLAAVWAQADALRGPDGYLVGERFSAADLTFAALAASHVQPEGYGVLGKPLPSPETMPAALRQLISEARETPSGRAVLALYDRHRRATRSTAAP